VSTSTVPPTNQTTSFETQMIPMTPQVLRRTLRPPEKRISFDAAQHYSLL
jgi:hypothetical protein